MQEGCLKKLFYFFLEDWYLAGEFYHSGPFQILPKKKHKSHLYDFSFVRNEKSSIKLSSIYFFLFLLFVFWKQNVFKKILKRKNSNHFGWRYDVLGQVSKWLFPKSRISVSKNPFLESIIFFKLMMEKNFTCSQIFFISDSFNLFF